MKRTYVEKIQDHLSDMGNTRMLQGVQALTDYKSKQGVDNDDTTLPDRLNNFAHFAVSNPIVRQVLSSGEMPVCKPPTRSAKTTAEYYTTISKTEQDIFTV